MTDATDNDAADNKVGADLPDILAIVMEMGRDRGRPPQEQGPPTKAPSPASSSTRAHGSRPFGGSSSFDRATGPSAAPEGGPAAPPSPLGEPPQVHRSAGAAGHAAALPAAALPAPPEQLAGRARARVAAAGSANTRRAYAADWRHFCAWCRRQGFAPLPPDPQTVRLYITALASGTAADEKKAVATIERRLAALAWNYAQRGQKLDRKDRAIAAVMAGIRTTHATPPRRKEALLPEDLVAMLETLPRGTLRGLRDRAILLVGFAGGLRRSEIVGLDCGRGQTGDGRGWVEFLGAGLLVTLRGKTGWREIEIGRGLADATCPVAALETWLKLARIAHGPLFRRVTGRGKAVGPERLNAQEVARLVKRAALAAGVGGDLSEGERARKFAGHSLRAGFASSAEAGERHVQKQPGHASAGMTHRDQRRRDRFGVNLTKASGL